MAYIYEEDLKFINEVIGEDPLSRTKLWFAANLKPDEVFDSKALIKHVQENNNPEDVFPEDELKRWAEEQGYIKTE